ncbi:MAG: HvfC family RiPP maturation protein [Gammaproteobacteria bacterium]
MTTIHLPFQQLQRQWLAYLRDPEHQRIPSGIPERRMALYSGLLYNKFEDSLSACFPVTRAMLGALRWQRLLRAFIAKHRCLSPYYRHIPDQFVLYLQQVRQDADDPPYLSELAHFEWIELFLAIDDAEPVCMCSAPESDWLDARPMFSPVLRLLHYGYPVQRLVVERVVDDVPQQATHILGFRDTADAVQFIELNAAAARLLEILLESDCSVKQGLQQIAAELQYPEADVLFAFGSEILAELARQGAILGQRCG